MEIALTWNLVLLSILTMLFAYNFLLGQNATIKLVISTYIAILTADGVAKILKDFIFDPAPGIQELAAGHEDEIFTGIRLVLFLIAIVVFVTKGAFYVAVEKHEHWAMQTVIHAVFAALSAILFLSTVLIYLSGNSFVEGMTLASGIEIHKESFIAKILIDYYQFWFSLPAIAFLITSFGFQKAEE